MTHKPDCIGGYSCEADCGRPEDIPKHERCPLCNASLRGKQIPTEHLLKGYYGEWDGVTPQFYNRRIGVEVQGLYDGAAFWRCPDCGGEWPRKGMQWAWDATHKEGQ